MLLLDTNVAIHLRDADEPFVSRVSSLSQRVALSLVTLIELEAGLNVPADLARSRRQGYRDLLTFADVIGLDRPVVDAYGSIVGAIGFSRTRIFDRLIAATAIVDDLTLVTINGADFRDIPDLKLEVWPAPHQ